MSDIAGTVAGEATSAAKHRPVDIPGLTGVRVVAAVIVVAHHLRPLTDAIAPYPIATALRPILNSGVPSLDVFFLLSGFIIAHNYAHVLADGTPGSWRNYLHARLARIYPLHVVTFLGLCVILAVGALNGIYLDTDVKFTPFEFVGNLFMLQGMPGIPAWNLPSWSLTCEFAAYLVFPLFAARVLQVRWRTALVVAALALSVQMVVMFQVSSIASIGLEQPILGWPRVAGEFVAGAMAWVVWQRVLRPGVWADVVIMLCTAGAWWVLLDGHRWLWTIPLFAVMIPAIACATGPVGRFLAHPITQWGGRLSFAVYLVHLPVISVATMYLIPASMYQQHSTRGAALVLGGIFLVSFAFGALLHHGVEEPARRRLRRRFAARSARASTEPIGTPPRATEVATS